MTLRDCLDEFLGLFEKNLVDYFFWHLIEKNEPMSNFDTFREFYLRDLRYLVDLFIKYLQDSKILPILPLCELLFFLLNDIRRGQTACGVEKGRNYDIVSGKVIPCVDYGDEIVVAELKSDELIFNDDNQVQGAFRNLITYKREFGCRECEAEFFCGGRCPVLVKTSPKRAKQYCYLTRDFLALVKASLSTIKEVMATKNITDEMLYYPYGYLNLLTDVVP
ncbi:MAG: SPASM domain-containing protein [Candidatus Kryptonium sp.]